MTEVKVDHDPRYVGESEYREGGRAVRPRDAATLILVRDGDSGPEVLVGRRAAGHKFMPNKYVFPGGRVDPGDSRLRTSSELHPAVSSRLQLGCSETRARGLALAAIRETWEETGLVLGERDSALPRSRSPQWREFLREGVAPRLDTLSYIARAITPPYRKQRFDARFFMADVSLVAKGLGRALEGSGELQELRWVDIEAAQHLELPHITRLVLGEAERRLREGHGPEESGPFVYFRQGKPIIEQH